MKATQSCPTQSDLDSFARSQLPEAEIERIAAHLESCADCWRRVESRPNDEAFGDDVRWAATKAAETVVDVNVSLDRLNALLPEYEVLEEIGRGGMGIVFKARHSRLDRLVALKILPTLLAVVRPDAVARFRRETALAARLEHTNIIGIYDCGEADGTLYYAMQYIPGCSLRDLLHEVQETGALDTLLSALPHDVTGSASSLSDNPKSSHTEIGTSARIDQLYYRQVATWIVEVAEALQYAHSHGIIHRDVKPSNLMVAPDGRLMITDFGLARSSEFATVTVSRSILGTVRYMCPEQVDPAGKDPDVRSDVYSLGATLYELLAFRPMFAGVDDREVMNQVLHADPVRPTRYIRGVPWELETICMKAIDKDRNSRYESAQSMADDLRRYLLDLPILARRQTAVARIGKWFKRRRLASALVSLLVITSIAGGLAFASYRDCRRKAVAAQTDAADRKAQMVAIEATSLLQEGRFLDAMERITDGLAIDPTSNKLCFIRAKLLGCMGREEEAVECLDEILRRSPDYWEAHYLLALNFTSYEIGKRHGRGPNQWSLDYCADRAKKHRAVFEGLVPSGAKSLVLRSMCEDDPQKALDLLNEAAAEGGDKMEVLIGRVGLHIAAGRYEMAIRDADALVVLAPGWTLAHERRTRALMKLGRYSEAEESCSRLIRLEPKAERHWLSRGTSRVELGRFEEALADLNESIRLNDDLSSTYISRARAHAGLGDVNSALSDCDRAIELNRSDKNAYLERMVLNAQQKRWEAVVEDATRMIELDPVDLPGYRNRSVALHELGLIEREVADLTKCIELVPDNPVGYRTRGRAYTLLQRDEEAIDDFSQAIELNGRPNDYTIRAHLYILSGRFADAIPDLSRIIELGAEPVRMRLRRGMVYEAAGANALALADYDQVAETSGPHAEYARLSRYLLLRRTGESVEIGPSNEHQAELGNWTDRLIALFAGSVSEGSLLGAAATDDERCEAHYYIGMKALLEGREAEAKSSFLSCVEMKRPTPFETFFSTVRLTSLGYHSESDGRP